jgi:2'-5' RNA ligase
MTKAHDRRAAAPVPSEQLKHSEVLRDHWWWRPGWEIGQRAYTWHLTFDGQNAAGARELRQLAAAHQEALAPIGALGPIPLPWLHLTMQGVGFTSEVTAAQAGRIAGAARPHLAGLPPLVLRFGPAQVSPEAVLLNPAEPEPVAAVRRAVRAGIAEVLGEDRVPERADRFRPHVSVAYSTREDGAGPAVAAVEAVTATAEVPVAAASLLVIHRDRKVYQWEIVEQVPIGGQ